MSKPDQAECRGVLLDETPLAIHVALRHSPLGGPSWWIPRSQIGYMRKDKVDSPFVGGGVNTFVVFTCPEWLLEEKQAWDLVP